MKTLKKIKSQSLSEIFQSMDIKFSFVHKIDKDNYVQLSCPAKCRDFLGDCIWSIKKQIPAYIYGFSFDGTKTKIDTTRLRLSLTFPDEKSKANFISNFNLGFISSKEKLAEVTCSKLHLTNDSMTIIIEASKTWQSVQWKLSLYTFYLKCCSYKDPSIVENPENGYLSKLKENNNEEILLKNVKTNNKEYLPETISEAHNRCGFVSVLNHQNIIQYKLIFGENND